MPLPFSKQIYRHGYKVELLVLKKKRDQFHILILGSTLKVRQGFLTSHWCPILCGFHPIYYLFLLLVCDLFSPHADYQQRQYSRAEEENQHLIGSVWDNLEGNAADKGTYQQRKPSVLSFCNPGDTFR